MRFACDSCGAQYMIADEKVGARGVKVKCKKCGNMIVVKPAPEAAAAAAAAAPSAPADTGAEAGAFGAPASAPQGELGGAFNSMFGSGAEAPAGQGADASSGAEANGNGSYANGNGEGGATDTAFGFQSTYNTGGETDLALGALERQPQAPSPGSDRDGERVWYVAIEDAQVGPVNLAEIEERWDGKEIDEDTLVWKSGMADWIPLVDVADLAYLITERPQARVSRPAMAASASMGAQAGGGMQAASFAPTEMADEPSWKPSAASALSSLVQEELVAKKPEAPEAPSAPKGMEGLGIPSIGGASDIFGQGSGEAGPPITVGQPAPAADPYGSGGSPAWSVPSARRQGMSAGLKVGIVVLVLVVLGGLGYGGFAFLQSSTKAQQEQADKAAKLLAQIEETKRQEEELRKKRELEEQNAPPVAPPIPAAAPAAPQPEDHRRNTAGRKTAGADKDDDKDDKRVAKNDKKPAAPNVDDVFKAPEVKDSLTKDDIVDGVKANAAKLGPCVTAARTKEEIQPGRVQFVLDWTITPSGSVVSPRLKGPQEVLSTSLPSCFARVMGSWKFAASKQGAPISNFPLPINVH